MSRHQLKFTLLTTAAACVAVAAPGSHAAAQTTDAPRTVGLEEVVVTAQRREERLQDVPISVTALTTEQLEQKQVTDVISLGKVAPGLQIKTTLTPLEITTAIRGVTMLIPVVSIDPPIGIYIDGVYNAITAGTNASMIDMERVEVLKGPQGTLFGRNTIGGAISITTAKPTDQFEGYGQVDIGNFQAYTLTGVANVPLVPGRLDSRFVYQYTEHDGYGVNRVYDEPNASMQQAYFRGSVRLQANEDWDVLVTGAYTRASGHSPGARATYIDPVPSLAPGVLPPLNAFLPAVSGRPGDLLTNYVDRGDYWDTYNSNLDTFYLSNYRLSGTITGKLNDAVTMKSITAYSKTRYNTSSDLDGTPYILVDLLRYPIHQHQFSEEIQFYGDAMDSRLTWITGAYYFSGLASHVSYVDALPAVTQAFAPGSPRTLDVTNGMYGSGTKSYAAFAQATFEILPKLRLTGGIRYTKDTRNILYRPHVELLSGGFVSCRLANAPNAPNLEACAYRNKVKYDYWPWTVGLDYKPADDVLLYAKLSKGYRSGAWQQSGPLDTGNAVGNANLLARFAPVAPEQLLSPEIGAKMEFLDNRLRVNVAGYYSDYKNIQLSVVLPAPCTTCSPSDTLLNSGVAHMWGGELEVTALIGGLRLDGSIGIVDPKYVKGANVGLPLVNVSKTNLHLGATYTVATEMGMLTLNGDYSWRSKVTVFSTNASTPAIIRDAVTQPSFGTFDARASFELSNMPVTLSVYGQNLANKKYFVSGQQLNAVTSFSALFPAPPRTYGVALKYSF